MANPVVHFEIMGGDAAREQAFYRDLFGWDVSADNEWNYGVVDTKAGTGINGGIGGGDQGGNRVTVYVGVEDPQTYLDKAVSLGATVMMPPTEIPGIGVVALFADPAGLVTGLFKGA